MNDFGKDLGLQIGDVLLEWNGSPISLESYEEAFEQYYANTHVGQKVLVKVRREVKGKTKEVKLKAKAIKVQSSKKHVLEEVENPSPEQQKIKAIWLSNT